MAAPQARSWANLPADCLHAIFDRVPCAADRHRAYHACTAWLNALVEVDCPPALPWLLPAPDRDGASATRVVCVLSDYRVHHHHHHLPFTTPRARYFGSHDGAWVFLAIREPRGHQLLNVRTGDVLDLPSEILLDLPTFQRFYSLETSIHAAALSSSPDAATCIAVFIVAAVLAPHRRFVAIWCNGWSSRYAMEISFFHPDPEDVVYHHGAFYFLHGHGGHISVCTPPPDLSPDNHLAVVGWEHRRFDPRWRRQNYNEFVRARYLVSSRGELLMVVRFTTGSDQQTSKFRVFRATERPQNPEGDAASVFPVAAYPCAWSELDTLDGRILFVGYGCSRAYELNDAQGRVQYKGFKAGIYFLDHREYYFLDAELYPCSDNGRWSESDGRVHLCFPPADPSWNSPPAWLLP